MSDLRFAPQLFQWVVQICEANKSNRYPWSQGRVHNTMKVTRSFLPDESSASIKWAENDAIIYAIVNTDTPNRFGEFPGYRIKRSELSSLLSLPFPLTISLSRPSTPKHSSPRSNHIKRIYLTPNSSRRQHHAFNHLQL